MNRRVMLLLLAGISIFEREPAVASNILETTTFVFALPEGWVRDLTTFPVSARGPKGELLEITSSRITGPPGESAELSEIRRKIEQTGIRTLRIAESEPNLSVEKPISRTVFGNNAVLDEVVYHARDTGWKIAQFSVVGPRTAVFVSLRVPGEQIGSIGAIRSAITQIQWVVQ